MARFSGRAWSARGWSERLAKSEKSKGERIRSLLKGASRDSIPSDSVVSRPGVTTAITWEVLGDGADRFTIDENGVVRVLGTTVIDYGDWRQNVGQITRQQWEEGYLTSGFADLLNTQYGIKVKVTDAAGQFHIKDVYFWVDGGNVVNEIYGTEFADTISAIGTMDRVYGLGGDDHIIAGRNKLIYGGDGNDILESPYSKNWSYNSSGSVLYGGEGDDEFRAWYTDVRLIGGVGADTFINTKPHSSHTNQTIISYETSDEGVNISRTGLTGFVVSGGDAEGDTFVGEFDKFRGSEHADVITINGGRGAIVWGGRGDDVIDVRGVVAPTIYGEDGDDTITVSGGTVYGGRGNDTVVFLGNAPGTFYDDDDSAVDADDIVFGSRGNDTIHLGVGNDTFVFQMNGGQDRVHGLTANDTIRLSGIAAFTSIQDVAADLYETSIGTDLWMGYTTDHPHAYAPGTPFSAIGKITFVGASVSDVLAAGWEFV